MELNLSFLDKHTPFPSIERATPDGLLAVGGDLSLPRMLEAYDKGIFPWYNPGDPILWWSPDPRMVLSCDAFKVSRSLAKRCRQIARNETKPDAAIKVLTNTSFLHVIMQCAATRINREGTWISPEIIRAYFNLHQQGYAHSVELWSENKLVGGLYGVCMGRFFFGESMFATQTDASKIALYYLVQFLKQQDITHVDCQQETPHLASLGAQPIARSEFAQLLNVKKTLTPPVWQAGQLLASGELAAFDKPLHNQD